MVFEQVRSQGRCGEYEYAGRSEVKRGEAVGGDGIFVEVEADNQATFLLIDVSEKAEDGRKVVEFVEYLLRNEPRLWNVEIGELLTELNGLLYQLTTQQPDFMDPGCMIPAGAVQIGFATGEVSLLHAGIFKPCRGIPGQPWSCWWPEEGGPPLRTDEYGRYSLETFQLAPGECLLICSDGVNEAVFADDELVEFGEEGLLNFLGQLPSRSSVTSIVESLWGELEAYSGASWPSDDTSVIVLGRKNPQ